MITVVGVRFQSTGKSYYFDPLTFEPKRGTHVIVDTARGREFGVITIPPIQVQDDKVVQPLRPILRIATEEDEKRNEENRIKSQEAGKICEEKIAAYGLEMKLVETEYTFDRSKLLFYFTADGRVDFRELVKDLASVFRTRIELRQIGVRDEAKLKGGLGMCGRELCCTTFLSDFAPVSIRMAKEQNLSLNPTKISGACGRLMCCLKNEQETYEYLNKKLPKHGQHVRTIDETEGTVHSVNILKQTIKVMFDENGEKEIKEYPVEELAYGDKDFECEPRRREEENHDYFAEQLRRAAAAVDAANEPEEEKEKEHKKSRSRNRNRSRSRSRDGESQGRQDGEKKQGGEKKQQGGEKKQRRGDGESRQGERKQTDGRQGEKKQRSAQQGEKRRREENRPSQGADAAGKQENRHRRSGGGAGAEKSAGEKQGSVKQNTQKKDGAEQGGTQEKSSRNRSRSRNRNRQNREGKPQQSDAAGTKQSDTGEGTAG